MALWQISRKDVKYIDNDYYVIKWCYLSSIFLILSFIWFFLFHIFYISFDVFLFFDFLIFSSIFCSSTPITKLLYAANGFSTDIGDICQVDRISQTTEKLYIYTYTSKIWQKTLRKLHASLSNVCIQILVGKFCIEQCQNVLSIWYSEFEIYQQIIMHTNIFLLFSKFRVYISLKFIFLISR